MRRQGTGSAPHTLAWLLVFAPSRCASLCVQQCPAHRDARSARSAARSAVSASAAARATPPVRHFINLSNGAEALPLLEAAGVPSEQVSFIRVQSSHCEAQDYYGLLHNLDHNLLMHLALGFDCRVYDFGSRGNYWEVPAGGADEAGRVDGADTPSAELQYVPRALWWGLEWSRYALNSLWRLETSTPLLRGYNVADLFDTKLRVLPKPLYKRLKYYRSYLAPGLQELRLSGYYAQTTHDGKKEVYRAFLGSHADRAAAEEVRDGMHQPPGERRRDALDPLRFSTPMRRYDARVARRVGEHSRGKRSSEPRLRACT
jgi:hypothetical protein